MRASDSSPHLPATQTGFPAPACDDAVDREVTPPLPRGLMQQMGLSILTALFLGLSGCGSDSFQDILQQASKALRTGDSETAIRLSDSVPTNAAEWKAAQVIAGRAAASQRDTDAALSRFSTIPHDGSPESLEAAWLTGEMRLSNCELAAAAEELEYVLRHQPDWLQVRERLATVYSSCGLSRRAAVHQLKLLLHGQISIRELVAFTEPDRHYDAQAVFQHCLKTNPQDPLLAFAAVRNAVAHQQTATAQRAAQWLVSADPKFAEAQALLGELLLDGPQAELRNWYGKLPDQVRDDAAVLHVLGGWAQRLGKRDVAIHCYWKAAIELPHDRKAAYQLGQLLATSDERAAQAFSRRAESLLEYSRLMEKALIGHGTDDESLQRIIALLIEMGRDWEAFAWAELTARIGEQRPWLEPIRQSLAYLPGSDAPRFREDRSPARLFDFSHLPDFESLDVLAEPHSPGSAAKNALPEIAFEGQSSEIGIDFVYDQSPDAESHGVRIFESTGGGAGVFDIDHDGWPDLYLTQGEPWPPGSNVPHPSSSHCDALYRNRQTSFENVTELAGLGDEDGYGQGCSCGDLNNDGFIDLYVANIGRNQLLLNNGDGTFSDVTYECGLDAEEWTTSCLIVDLNADGQPDLYDVNYLRGEQIFSAECGATHCSVRDFPGARDRVLLSQGELTLASVSEAAPEENAKGLGIVTVYSPGDTKPSLFIANDQVPNFFLRPTTAEGKYEDLALTSGLSVNRHGQPTACMGVAAADLNRDGLIDLFVTNFESEANNLYVQREGSFFEDAIVGSGLMAPGLPYVGWGTQFLDADNDGEPDLIVANGHVADFGEMNVEYQMPLQFFRNVSGLQFEPQQPKSNEPLFEQKSLGRSIARLDWNRDGLPDFVTTRIAAPTILATNRTQTLAHWLNIRLTATRSSRDASGAIVTVLSNGIEHRQQLIRGDGYQASNDPVLHFGLADSTGTVRVTIAWPSGAVSAFDSALVDCELLIVEGCSSPAVFTNSQVHSLTMTQ